MQIIATGAGVLEIQTQQHPFHQKGGKKAMTSILNLSNALNILSNLVAFGCLLALPIVLHKRKRQRVRMTPDEFKVFKKWLSSLPSYEQRNTNDRELQAQAMSVLPSTYDPRSRLSPVKDQGACGSCAIYSLVGATSDQYSIKQGRVVDLSEQYVIDCLYDCIPPSSYVSPPCDGNVPYYLADAFLMRPLQPPTSPTTCGPDGTVLESCVPNKVWDTHKTFHTMYAMSGTYGAIFLLERACAYYKKNPRNPLYNIASKCHPIVAIVSMLFLLVCVLVIPFLLGRIYPLWVSTTWKPVKSIAIALMVFASILLVLLIISTVIDVVAARVSSRTDGYVLLGAEQQHFGKLKKWLTVIGVLLSLLVVSLLVAFVVTFIEKTKTKTIIRPTTNATCPTQCQNRSEVMDHYYAKAFYSMNNDIETIKNHIYTQGSVGVGVQVPNSNDWMNTSLFNGNDGSIDFYSSNNWHAMVIIGWKDDAWIVRNSWGKHFKNKGYCYWKMGTGYIENNAYCVYI